MKHNPQNQQAKAARKLRNMHLSVIGTAYVLIDGGHDSAVARVTGTAPMSLEDPELILDRVLAAQFMGHSVSIWRQEVVGLLNQFLQA